MTKMWHEFIHASNIENKVVCGIKARYYIYNKKELLRDGFITMQTLWISPEIKETERKRKILESIKEVRKQHKTNIMKIIKTKKIVSEEFVHDFFKSRAGTIIC